MSPGPGGTCGRDAVLNRFALSLFTEGSAHTGIQHDLSSMGGPGRCYVVRSR